MTTSIHASTDSHCGVLSTIYWKIKERLASNGPIVKNWNSKLKTLMLWHKNGANERVRIP